MIVYVESNFILEIALEQEESHSAVEILNRAESKEIDLFLPSFSFSEPFSTVRRRGSERTGVCERLQQQLRELGRSESHRSTAVEFESVPTVLLKVEKEEVDRLESTVARLLSVAQQIHLSPTVFSMALDYEQRYGLSPQDAIIYSSVVSDLKCRRADERKCFLSRNSRDFSDVDISAELESYGCVYLPKFADGLGYALSR